MAGGNRDGLLRLIESAVPAIPKTILAAYPRDEIVNATWLILKSRSVRRPSKLQVRCAAIDFHRSNTKYRRVWGYRNGVARTQRHGDVHYSGAASPDRVAPNHAEENRETLAEHLRDVRRRFGTDGLAVFLLARVMELRPAEIGEIMDFAPDSALAKSIAGMRELR